MNLLIFDEKYNDDKNDYISVLNKNLNDYSISLSTSFHEAKKIYEDTNFNILIIDFTSEMGKLFLDFILEIDPKQRVITIGYELTHSESLGCDFCEKTYKKRRLVKPISVINLYKTIVEFDKIKCKYKDSFDDLSLIIKQLLQKYDYFEFDESKNLISRYEKGTQGLKQLLSLIDDFKKYKIEHEVVDDKTIKVLSID